MGQAVDVIGLSDVSLVNFPLLIVLLEFLLPKLHILVVKRGTFWNGRYGALCGFFFFFILTISLIFVSDCCSRLCDLGWLPIHHGSKSAEQRQVDELTLVLPKCLEKYVKSSNGRMKIIFLRLNQYLHCERSRHEFVHVRGTLQLGHLLMLWPFKKLQ